jgi:hypothetical protein
MCGVYARRAGTAGNARRIFTLQDGEEKFSIFLDR